MRIKSFREAANQAFEMVGASDMSPEVCELSTLAIDAGSLGGEADKVVSSTVHSRYGRSATWSGKRWLIPVPRLGYNAQPIPHLCITLQTYLVSPIKVETSNNYYYITLVGPLGRAEKLILPIPFLQAILDDALEKYEIVGCDSTHTAWNIPGLKEAIVLPKDFPTGLSGVLRHKTVAEWLLDFGSEGINVATWVVGTLIGLQLHGMTEPSPAGERPWRRENVLACLTQLYGREWAEEMFRQGAPFLRASMTDRAAVQLILQEADKFRKILHKEL